MSDRDQTYPDADLVTCYRPTKKAKTVHVDTTGEGRCACDADLADMIEAGWLRQVLRQGLTLCPKVDLDPAEEE